MTDLTLEQRAHIEDLRLMLGSIAVRVRNDGEMVTCCRKIDNILDALQQAQQPKSDAFKAYVHERLDAMGVPVDPDSPHKAAGCRIGGRLDWIEQRITQQPDEPMHIVGRRNGFLHAVDYAIECLTDSGYEFTAAARLKTVREVIARMPMAQQPGAQAAAWMDAAGDVMTDCQKVGIIAQGKFNEAFASDAQEASSFSIPLYLAPPPPSLPDVSGEDVRRFIDSFNQRAGKVLLFVQTDADMVLAALESYRHAKGGA